MKLVVLALCLCLVNAESKENARRGKDNVSMENHRCADLVSLNDQSSAEDDAANDSLEPELEERTFLKPKQIVLSRKYAVFPGGKVPIPEGIQQYRRCFGDFNLQNILEWIVNSCAKGMCGSMQNSGFDLGQSNGQSNLLGGLSEWARMIGDKLQSNKEDEEVYEALREDEEDEPETQQKNNAKKNNSNEKTRKKGMTPEQAADKKANKDKGESKKEISDKKANVKRKVIPYRRERRELENVTLQFKALPNDQKDKFCEYLENDLEDPMEVLQSMLGALQFGDKKESGVHYDRNRGRTLASIGSRTDRETQILRWACQDRRAGQRKLYLSTKRFFAAQKANSRRRKGQRNAEVESNENHVGDLALQPPITLDEKVTKNRSFQQGDYSALDELAARFNRLYSSRSANSSGANHGSRSFARSADDEAEEDDEKDYINALENEINERRAYRNIRRGVFKPRTPLHRYLARF